MRAMRAIRQNLLNRRALRTRTLKTRTRREARTSILTRIGVAGLAVLATAAFSLTAPAAARTPVTTKDLAALRTCMTPHQAWVWEKAVVSVPAIVLIPPRLCRS